MEDEKKRRLVIYSLINESERLIVNLDNKFHGEFTWSPNGKVIFSDISLFGKIELGRWECVWESNTTSKTLRSLHQLEGINFKYSYLDILDWNLEFYDAQGAFDRLDVGRLLELEAAHETALKNDCDKSCYGTLWAQGSNVIYSIWRYAVLDDPDAGPLFNDGIYRTFIALTDASSNELIRSFELGWNTGNSGFAAHALTREGELLVCCEGTARFLSPQGERRLVELDESFDATKIYCNPIYKIAVFFNDDRFIGSREAEWTVKLINLDNFDVIDTFEFYGRLLNVQWSIEGDNLWVSTEEGIIQMEIPRRILNRFR